MDYSTSKGFITVSPSTLSKSVTFLVIRIKLLTRAVEAMTASAIFMFLFLFISIALFAIFSSKEKTLASPISCLHFSKPSGVCLSHPRNSIFVRIEILKAFCAVRLLIKSMVS